MDYVVVLVRFRSFFVFIVWFILEGYFPKADSAIVFYVSERSSYLEFKESSVFMPQFQFPNSCWSEVAYRPMVIYLVLWCVPELYVYVVRRSSS